MESLARKYWKDKNKIAKLTSYGSYLDCEYITAKYPEDESHIVGDLAEYVYDLEQENEKLKQDKEHLNYHLIDKNCECELLKLDQNQKAIAELEKARNEIKNMPLDNTGHDNYDFEKSTINYCLTKIDQQIKSLKGEK